MDKMLTYYLGDAFSAKESGEFSKDVLRVGRYVHPITKQIVDIDAARLDRLERNTAKYLSVVGSVPFPDGHKWDAMSNLGHWPGPFKRIGDRLFGLVKVTEPKAADMIRNGTTRGVSAVIEFGKTDQAGNKYDEVITQVCATDYPVVTEQGAFVELSALDEKQRRDMFGDEAGNADLKDRNGTGGQDMDLTKLIEALGLPKGSDEKTVLAKAGEVMATQRAASEKLEALSAALPEHGLKLGDDGKLAKVEQKAAPEPTASEKELMQRLSAAEAETKAARMQVEVMRLNDQRKKLQALSAAGKIPPALLPKFEKIMSVSGDVQALVLSADGATAAGEKVRLDGLLMELFSAMPTQVELASALAYSPEKEKDADALRKRAREIASRAGKVKAEAK